MITIWKRRTIKKDILLIMKRDPDRIEFSSREMSQLLGISVLQMKKAKEFLVKDGSIVTLSPGKFKLLDRDIRPYNSRMYNKCVFQILKDNGYGRKLPYCTIHDKFLDNPTKCNGTVEVVGNTRVIRQHCKMWEPSTGIVTK